MTLITRLPLLLVLLTLLASAQDIVFHDGFEFFDPPFIDTDADGLGDAEEAILGTSPVDPDTDNDGFGDGSEVAVGTDPLDPSDFPAVPPSPETVAPEPNPSVASSLLTGTEFLYSGVSPIQTDVAPGTIELSRAALLRGTVFTRRGAPLPGVTVRVLGHPEFGSTQSRADGMYDLAVNGGAALTLDYQLDGYLPAQRTLDVAWQEYAVAPDVALIPLDPVVTPIDLAAPGAMKVARGSVQIDDDGERQATILFPAGVSADLRMPDDSTLPISNLSVRATEYTVGAGGEMAMPGDLPPTSGYTYAVELSIDEAMAMGAARVDFDQPLPFYVENFLGFPAGTPVPTGYYDRNLGAWVPEPDGVVIKIVSESGGLANVDLDGDNVADSGVTLTGLGITDAERVQLASLYDPGQSLWRVPVEHFTAWDHNWPIGPPNDATYPDQERAYSDTYDEGMCLVEGSIIECQNQVLRKQVAVAGTAFTLNYSSHRVPGRLANRHLEIPLTDTHNPASLRQVTLRIFVGGRLFEYSYDPEPNLLQPFTWDGEDPYGRIVQGRPSAKVRIGYEYEGVYRTGGSGTASFGQPGQLPLEVIGNRTRADFILPQEYTTAIGGWDARGQGLGGWTLDVHHFYDPTNRVLYRGDGTRRSAVNIPDVLNRVVGTVDERGFAERCPIDPDTDEPDCRDGVPATETYLEPMRDIAFGPDGSLYITQPYSHRIRRVRPDGIIETFAGTGESYRSGQDGSLGPNGDGGPASQAKLDQPRSLAVDKLGNVYIGEQFTRRVRKVDPNGTITTFAGGGVVYPPNGPARDVRVWPLEMDVDADGNLYIVDICTVFRIDPEGQSSVIAGSDINCGNFSGDGGPAIQAGLNAEAVAVGPDGSIYIADSGNYRVRRIDKDGTIRTVAGTGTRGFSGDGGSALNAEMDYVFDIAVRSDGAVYVGDGYNYRLRLIDTDGVISTVAGVGPNSPTAGLEGPATSGWLIPDYLALDADETPHVAGAEEVITAIRTAAPGLQSGELLVPSEDGSEVYKFTDAGRHLQTLHALTGAVLWQFTYDGEGRLVSVTDGDGKVTTVQRDGQGVPTGIVGPFGHVTQFGVDANGFLERIANPAGEELEIASTAGGLIILSTDPRGLVTDYGYDDLGRLVSHGDNAGFRETFARTGSVSAAQVERTTSLNRTTTHQVTRPFKGTQSNVNTSADASTSSAQFAVVAGTSSAESRSGMQSVMTEGPDPRFGMQSPIIRHAQIGSPGGPTMIAESASEAVLNDPNDPFSVVTLTDTTQISGRITTSVYAAAGRTLTQTSPEGRVSALTIDPQGRVTTSEFGGLAGTVASFNGMGQLEMLVHGTGGSARETAFAYETDGFLAEMTDPLGRAVGYSYDAAGRITNKTLPGGFEIAFGYNAAGELASVTPPGRPAHAFTYTKFGRLASYTPPTVSGTGANFYSYNADQLLTAIDRADGERVELTYDAEGRVGSVVLKEGAAIVASYQYSYVTGTQPDMVTGPGNQTVSFSYQGDLPTGVTWGGIVEGTVTRSYDDGFRVVSQAVNGGTTVNFVHDDDDLLTAAGAFTITRNAANGLAQSAALGVLADAWSYNDFGETVAYSASADGSPVYETAFTRDALGRITQKVETIGGATDTWDYAYDDRGQLVEVQLNNVVIEEYAYDDNGNRTGATVDAVTVTGSYDVQDRVAAYGDLTFTHSPAGRLASRTAPGNLVTDYGYDPAGNLRSVMLPDGTELGYAYDGLDRRIERRVDGAVTQRWLYDGGLPVAELDGTGDLVSQFVYAGGHVPAYLIRGGVNYRIVTDQVGSVRLVVNGGDGSIAQRLDYDSFGNVLLDTNPGFQPFGFAGGLQDPDSGLVLFGARDYDPTTGRWAAKDLLLFGGDDTNLYRYANNNPINLADPGGTDFWDKALGLLNGVNEGLTKAINPAAAIQSASEGLTDWLLGDWMDRNGFYRKPYAGMLYPPPAGVDTSDYLDYHFYGECAVDLLSLGAGGYAGAAPKLGSLAGKLGNAVDKLRRFPNLFKGLGNGLGNALRRGWDEASVWGKKLLDEVVTVEQAQLKPKLKTDVKLTKKARDDIFW